MKQFTKDLGNVSIAPKGKWNRKQEYERLALVYNTYDNFSYIAKINVPNGIDIENREYWQPMNITGYADNNFINLTTENENGTITAFENLEEAVATVLSINRRAGAILSFYNLNSDRLDRQAEFELWQFNSADITNWEDIHKWRNIYYVDEQLNDLSNRCTQIENIIKNIQSIPKTKIEQLFDYSISVNSR